MSTSVSISSDADNTFPFCEISHEELKELFKKIQNQKSLGSPKISSSLFKTSAKILLNQFRFLYILCLTTAIFPNSWKFIVVTPFTKQVQSMTLGITGLSPVFRYQGKSWRKVFTSDCIITWNISTN